MNCRRSLTHSKSSRFGLDLVLLLGFDEVLSGFFREVAKSKDFLTIEPRALHDAVGFEFVGCDNGTTDGTGVRDDSHR